jgi:hypothetical protein
LPFIRQIQKFRRNNGKKIRIGKNSHNLNELHASCEEMKRYAESLFLASSATG